MSGVRVVKKTQNYYRRRYTLRKTGGVSRSFEVTIPYEVVERYARKHGVDINEATKKLDVEVLYDDIQSADLLVKFVKKDIHGE